MLPSLQSTKATRYSSTIDSAPAFPQSISPPGASLHNPLIPPSQALRLCCPDTDRNRHSLPSPNRSKLDLTSLVQIGHLFGTWTNNGLIALEPDFTSAVILTGYSFNPNGTNSPAVLQGYAPHIAHLQRPKHFATLDSGYLTTADIFFNINQFFKAPDCDGVAAYPEKSKSPFAIIEVVSLNPVFLLNNASRFNF